MPADGNANPPFEVGPSRAQIRRWSFLRAAPLTLNTKTHAEANSMFQLLFYSWTNNSLCQQLVGVHGIYFSASKRNWGVFIYKSILRAEDPLHDNKHAQRSYFNPSPFVQLLQNHYGLLWARRGDDALRNCVHSVDTNLRWTVGSVHASRSGRWGRCLGARLIPFD